MEEWTTDELRRAVKAYVKMHRDEKLGKTFVKKEIYARLHKETPNRSAKSFEYRMQNISAVYASSGRTWVKGLKPKFNVGANVFAQIKELLFEVEGSNFAGFTSPEMDVLVSPDDLVDIPEGDTSPEVVDVASKVFLRDPNVISWVLNNSKGRCELCDQPAPFTNLKVQPYLEVHHVRRLADGGSDTISNAVAVCANCHMELHYGLFRDEKRCSLLEKLKRLIAE